MRSNASFNTLSSLKPESVSCVEQLLTTRLRSHMPKGIRMMLNDRDVRTSVQEAGVMMNSITMIEIIKVYLSANVMH